MAKVVKAVEDVGSEEIAETTDSMGALNMEDAVGAAKAEDLKMAEVVETTETADVL